MTKVGAYYNEIDPQAAAWLRELIRCGLIADGEVDERSIEDVVPTELVGFTQCHFFAGIGGWSLALRRAGWEDSRPVWTGSCPCQPFSAAGKGGGFADERHLWPAFYHLIEQHRPAVVFGEQVAAKAVEPWIDLVQADMEALGYAFGCVAFPSAGVGAPHIRDRAYWVADAEGFRGGSGLRDSRPADQRRDISADGGGVVGMADADGGDPRAERVQRSGEYGCASKDSGALRGADKGSRFGAGPRMERPGPTLSIWRDADWLFCRDGKWRPVESGTFPLAHGIPARVGRLRGYGNAINVEAARVFIEAYQMGC
jgi:DNA (cytosine-5)-methyltransferase 1